MKREGPPRCSRRSGGSSSSSSRPSLASCSRVAKGPRWEGRGQWSARLVSSAPSTAAVGERILAAEAAIKRPKDPTAAAER
eukprot:scaffold2295_cov222-Pinguiococcus_pyrenoidosus.AAC.4